MPELSDNKDNKVQTITILVSILTALIGAPTAYTLIHDIFFTPNVTMDFRVDDNIKSNITLEVKNTGNEAATHYSLTVKSPLKISNSNLFMTENHTNLKKLLLDNNKTLQVTTPRLVQGPGSLLRLDFAVSPPLNSSNEKLIAYSTFDQGSSKSKINYTKNKGVKSFPELIEEWWSSPSAFYGSVLTFLIPIAFAIFMHIYKKSLERKRKKFSDY